MKGTIKTGLSRTYALRQYENIKPMVEIEIEFDTEKETDFDMSKALMRLKTICENYIEKFNPKPDNDELPFS
jgi:hypothetical protein